MNSVCVIGVRTVKFTSLVSICNLKFTVLMSAASSVCSVCNQGTFSSMSGMQPLLQSSMLLGFLVTA
jgi:hypothetical protein